MTSHYKIYLVLNSPTFSLMHAWLLRGGLTLRHKFSTHSFCIPICSGGCKRGTKGAPPPPPHSPSIDDGQYFSYMSPPAFLHMWAMLNGYIAPLPHQKKNSVSAPPPSPTKKKEFCIRPCICIRIYVLHRQTHRARASKEIMT